jgi:TPP-dependent pyruvate/acetoin dehydrogenase alpha subunit
MAVDKAVDKATLLQLYRMMVRIRSFEERARIKFMAGGMPGFLHLCTGEEAIAAGVMSVLRPDDYFTTHHRGHGQVLAKGGDPKLMYAELFGRVNGFCRGKGGSMHVASKALGMLGANGIVGASVPIGTGAAFACKQLKEDRIVVAFHGDASTNRGTWHEALNLASIWELPVVYVCENNLYGVANYQPDYMKIENIADRGASYGIPGVVCDGNDVEAVRAVAKEAIDRARSGGGPTLIEYKTWRHWGHFIGDPATYRDPAEHEKWLKRDPVPNTAKLLLSKKWATQTDLDAIQAEADAEMEAGIEFAESSPFPDKSELYMGVFA